MISSCQCRDLIRRALGSELWGRSKIDVSVAWLSRSLSVMQDNILRVRSSAKSLFLYYYCTHEKTARFVIATLYVPCLVRDRVISRDELKKVGAVANVLDSYVIQYISYVFVSWYRNSRTVLALILMKCHNHRMYFLLDSLKDTNLSKLPCSVPGRFQNQTVHKTVVSTKAHRFENRHDFNRGTPKIVKRAILITKGTSKH
jgi:hypothetical protein